LAPVAPRDGLSFLRPSVATCMGWPSEQFGFADPPHHRPWPVSPISDLNVLDQAVARVAAPFFRLRRHPNIPTRPSLDANNGIVAGKGAAGGSVNATA